jgi:hypothetical protein
MDRTRSNIGNPISPGAKHLLTEVAVAYSKMRHAAEDPERFGVPLGQLQCPSIRLHDLVELMLRGFVRLGQFPPGCPRSESDLRPGPAIINDLLIHVTPLAADFDLTQNGHAGNGYALRLPEPAAPVPAKKVKPNFDSQAWRLWVGHLLVKMFKQPANVQVTICEAFQAQRWPDVIEDPLPPRLGIPPQQRLRDAIKNLNRHQTHKCLQFFAARGAKGIGWRIISCATPQQP